MKFRKYKWKKKTKNEFDVIQTEKKRRRTNCALHFSSSKKKEIWNRILSVFIGFKDKKELNRLKERYEVFWLVWKRLDVFVRFLCRVFCF